MTIEPSSDGIRRSTSCGGFGSRIEPRLTADGLELPDGMAHGISSRRSTQWSVAPKL